ncbi:DUF202 domain-containing protein [Rhodobacteraceae bacterium KMM 6894]|nr:DUF202 domain-containing protein [Rhodobacteraceae bacterium KMM 6894]
MLRRYTDHAANERTFLAWVRTAISIVGFGLLITFGHGGSGTSIDSATGLALLILGMALVGAAGVRFLMIRKLIRSNEHEHATSVLLDVALMVIIVIMIATLLVFGLHVTNVA